MDGMAPFQDDQTPPYNKNPFWWLFVRTITMIQRILGLSRGRTRHRNAGVRTRSKADVLLRARSLVLPVPCRGGCWCPMPSIPQSQSEAPEPLDTTTNFVSAVAGPRREKRDAALPWAGLGGEKQRSFRVYRPFQCLSKLAVRSHLQHLEQVGVVLLLLLIIILLIFLLSLSFTFDLGFSTCIF